MVCSSGRTLGLLNLAVGADLNGFLGTHTHTHTHTHTGLVAGQRTHTPDSPRNIRWPYQCGGLTSNGLGLHSCKRFACVWPQRRRVKAWRLGCALLHCGHGGVGGPRHRQGLTRAEAETHHSVLVRFALRERHGNTIVSAGQPIVIGRSEAGTVSGACGLFDIVRTSLCQIL